MIMSGLSRLVAKPPQSDHAIPQTDLIVNRSLISFVIKRIAMVSRVKPLAKPKENGAPQVAKRRSKFQCLLGSGEIEAVILHHLGPGGCEVFDELLS